VSSTGLLVSVVHARAHSCTLLKLLAALFRVRKKCTWYFDGDYDHVMITMPPKCEERNTQSHLLLQVDDEPGAAALRSAADEHAGGARDRVRKLHLQRDTPSFGFVIEFRPVLSEN